MIRRTAQVLAVMEFVDVCVGSFGQLRDADDLLSCDWLLCHLLQPRCSGRHPRCGFCLKLTLLTLEPNAAEPDLTKSFEALSYCSAFVY